VRATTLVCACLPLGQASLAARLERNTAGTIMPAVVHQESAAVGGVESLDWEGLVGACERTVVVAVVAVGMMELAVHKVVGVAAMRNGRVPADGPVGMVAGALLRGEAGRALGWIRRTDADGVFVVMAFVRMMQVAAIEIVHMPVMQDGNVAAGWPVLVRVAGVGVFAGRARDGERRDADAGKDECFVHGLFLLSSD